MMLKPVLAAALTASFLMVGGCASKPDASGLGVCGKTEFGSLRQTFGALFLPIQNIRLNRPG